MDVLDDLQHGVRAGAANGAMELAINVVTSTLSPFVLRPIWSFATRRFHEDRRALCSKRSHDQTQP
jgi:hypothetical protein